MALRVHGAIHCQHQHSAESNKIYKALDSLAVVNNHYLLFMPERIWHMCACTKF